MVQNQQIYIISILREQTDDLDATLVRLADITGADLAAMKEAVRRRMRDPIYRPIPVIENASKVQVVRVKARQIELPAVLVQEVPTREYPDQAMAAHLIGYVGVANKEEYDAEKIPLLDRNADYFTLLGLPQHASPDEIRSTYFMLARKLHPDRLSAIGVIDERGRLPGATALTGPDSRASYSAR